MYRFSNLLFKVYLAAIYILLLCIAFLITLKLTKLGLADSFELIVIKYFYFIVGSIIAFTFIDMLIRFVLKDNIIHTILSFIFTRRIQHFMWIFDIENIVAISQNQVNKAIAKSYVNLYRDTIIFRIKLPRNNDAQRILKEKQDSIREELSSMINASFSGFDRQGRYLILKGKLNK
ncbi:hypothetical protein [Lysinibacillus fusiformis]|uniref:hypothetical protein n=1 Tax=Lysinibacillus fusiformis TaxID=28031 RepID=UPI003557152A